MFKAAFALAVATFVAVTPASANTKVVYDTVPAGQASFDKTVTNAGGKFETQELESGKTTYDDFTISKAPFYTYSEIDGFLTDIAPQGSVRGPNGDSRASGITFNFAAPINSFGLNVGDWGTCCLPSALYIAFDGGAAIQVGLADDDNPALRTNGAYSIFVAAFDDSAKFSKVEFWGDGFGEALYAGGTIRYAAIDSGTLPGGVPEPTTWALMILGFGAVGGAMRRRNTAHARAAFA
jgi:hypothetical protein